MIKEAILCCALGLPLAMAPMPPKPTKAAQEIVREYQLLMDLLRKTYPGSEFKIGPPEMHIMPKGYSLVPLRWHSNPIYYRKIRRNA